MKGFSKTIVKLKVPILILALALAIPSAVSYLHTKVNYDLLTYLPGDIDTMKGQDILIDEFGTGAFSMCIVEGMPEKEVSDLKKEIEQVDHVKKVLWYDSFLSTRIPMEMLPEEVYEAFNEGDATMMFVLFDESTSGDGTMAAVEEIRRIAGKKVFLAGMTGVLVDTRDLSEAEAPIYVIIAVILATLVLMLSMDSFLIPFLFLASIGLAILYNLGTNFFLGSISYVTKALAAVLQLGVTMDYSIFLWHSYLACLEKGRSREDAMAEAIDETFSSVVGSSVTTIAGFIALCFMSFTLGLDLGLVMAKGVLFGVISCVTVLPSMILVLHGALMKTRHRPLLPDLKGMGKLVTDHYRICFLAFLLLLIPALYGYAHTKVYYNLDSSLPRDLPGIVANEKQAEKFNTGATDMILVSSSVSERDVRTMARQLKKIDGVNYVLGLNTIKGGALPGELIPENLREALESENWQLLLLGSEYQIASDQVNAQCDQIESVIKEFDPSAMLIGEAPCTRDLIHVTANDFATVSTVSIGVIFAIILLVFRSLSLPFILVAVIELGIFINMGLPAYTGTVIPFIASIVIGTIQLGSTVDYAILMTTRYRRERMKGTEKKEAVTTAVDASAKSVLVSALAFFAATFGVGLYSNIDMISSLCTLMARGALISMGCVIIILPSFLMIFDRVITATSAGGRKKKDRKEAEVQTA
ncbi:MAG: MMPL family transporter [Lachnospiraceae bacterium]|nr:MMPL family transporter [Lachnospiraceae bacterium]